MRLKQIHRYAVMTTPAEQLRIRSLIAINIFFYFTHLHGKLALICSKGKRFFSLYALPTLRRGVQFAGICTMWLLFWWYTIHNTVLLIVTKLVVTGGRQNSVDDVEAMMKTHSDLSYAIYLSQRSTKYQVCINAVHRNKENCSLFQALRLIKRTF